ncbi:MAG TPA: FAD-dependent oxidoreductase [Candidatus Binatia bacterium]|nr:FAD-dependent oxidoreductase [Candidatus Binatia bacterium]
MPPELSRSRRPQHAVVERIALHNPETRSIFLRLPAEQGLTFSPGQFISLQLPVGGETLIRPYSIASNPEESELLEICLNRVPGGVGSAYLFTLRAGAVVHFSGPWGTFVVAEPPVGECVFIADATGVAPIRPMLKRILSRGSNGSVRLHYRADAVDELLYRGEWEAAEREHGRFQFEPLLDRSPYALLQSVRARYVDGDAERDRHFFICGVGDVVTKLRDLLRGAGYQRRAVQYEKW